MENTSFNLDTQDNESFYKHLLNIWEITPEAVKEKFRRTQKCSLCKDCKEYIEDLQRTVREEKMLKYAENNKTV